MNVYGAFIQNLARLLAKRRLDGKLCGHLADHQDSIKNGNSGFNLIFSGSFHLWRHPFQPFLIIFKPCITWVLCTVERRFDSVVRVIVKIF